MDAQPALTPRKLIEQGNIERDDTHAVERREPHPSPFYAEEGTLLSLSLARSLRSLARLLGNKSGNVRRVLKMRANLLGTHIPTVGATIT